MSNRYSRVFSFQENLYACGSPVVIAAGALLKDNLNGNIIAQIKLKNISDKVIKAIKVSISAKDTAGNIVNASIKHNYLDLVVLPAQEFGSKEPIFISDSSVRSFSAEVLQVVYTDGDVWNTNGSPWEQLPQGIQLIEKFRSQELVKQYQLEYGMDSAVFPQIYKDIWQCKCGEWNKRSTCHRCKASKEKILSFDQKALEVKKDERLKQETAENEEHRKTVANQVARRKTLIAFIAVIVLGVIVGLLVWEKIIVPNNNYKKAVSLAERGQYQEALTAFMNLGNYKDSEEQAQALKFPCEMSLLSKAKTGDNIFYGSYEQDNNSANGAEGIEWLVLSREDNRLLVISKYVLAYEPYNSRGDLNTTWEHCSLRYWLNYSFMNDAFTDDEKGKIANTTLIAKNDNPEYDTDPGNPTDNHLFILSIEEVEKFFVNEDARQCKPTAKVGHAGYYDYETGNCGWWLRSLGIKNSAAIILNPWGSVWSYKGLDVTKGNGVRPAMWINLS